MAMERGRMEKEGSEATLSSLWFVRYGIVAEGGEGG